MNYYLIALVIGIMVSCAWVPCYTLYYYITHKLDYRDKFVIENNGKLPCYCLMSNGACMQDRPFLTCPCILYDPDNIVFFKGKDVNCYK